MLAETKAQLDLLQKSKAQIESQLSSVRSQIDALTKTYNAIAPLVGVSPIPNLTAMILDAGLEALKAVGISAAVRSVLDSSPDENFTAATVRDRLATRGWVWGEYANPLATVHATLVRLAKSGFAKEDVTGEGKKCFSSAKRNRGK